MKYAVFTIVLNWNREQDTIECLESLLEVNTKNIDHTIVIVDNGSLQKSVDSIKSFIENTSIQLIETGKNLGFVEGNNVGIRHALKKKADWIMVINNDTSVDKELLQHLLNCGSSDEKVAIVSPKIYFAKGFEFHKDKYKKNELGKVLWYTGGEIDWNNVYGTNRGVDEVDHGQYDVSEEIDFATGACMFIRAKALVKDELFNPLYFMYMEDMEFSLKLKKRGYKIIYEPRAVLWHKTAQSSGIGSNLNDYFITRNRMLFGMSHAPLRAKVALVRESIRFMRTKNKWVRQAIIDFALGKFGKGSFVT